VRGREEPAEKGTIISAPVFGGGASAAYSNVPRPHEGDWVGLVCVGQREKALVGGEEGNEPGRLTTKRRKRRGAPHKPRGKVRNLQEGRMEGSIDSVGSGQN